VRRRQPEKILLPPELPDLLAEPVELGTLLTGEETLVARTALAAVDAGLPYSAGQAAGGKAESLGHGIAEEALLHAASAFCCVVNRRLVWVGFVIDGQSGGQDGILVSLSSKPGGAHG
jgi:hypothetical protein